MNHTVLSSLKAGIVIVGTVALTMAVLSIWSTASHLSEESAQRALLVEATQLLEEFHDVHARYPESLDELTFTFPDDGDESTLKALKYNSDGEHYLMVLQGVYSGETLTECR